MGDGTDWFRILMMLSALAICAPWAFRVVRTDRRVPQYIAIWLGVVLILALIFQIFGPF